MPDDNKLPIPSPAGTNANGEPYWIINGQEITWAQMQQAIWQQMQKTQAGASAGKGPEQLTNIPKIDELLDAVTKPDVAVENGIESGPSLNFEKSDNRIEVADKQKITPAIVSPKTEVKKPVVAAKIIGDTHKSSKLRLNFADVKEMYNFYMNNKQKAQKPNPQNADDYLVVLVGRLLRMMAEQK